MSVHPLPALAGAFPVDGQQVPGVAVAFAYDHGGAVGAEPLNQQREPQFRQVLIQVVIEMHGYSLGAGSTASRSASSSSVSA